MNAHPLLPLIPVSLLALHGASAQVTIERNPGAVFSEDAQVAATLEASLVEFLGQTRTGQFEEGVVIPGHLGRYGSFFKRLERAGTAEGSAAPSLLKSYTLDGETYWVTLAFGGVREGRPFSELIVELEARPLGETFAVGCPFERRTKDFDRTTFGAVTFHHRSPLDTEGATELARFRESFCRQTKTKETPLDYYCFASLDELLRSYGFVHDMSRCNELGYDLGFSECAGAVFVTGTGNPNYKFALVGEHLRAMPRAVELYRPMAVGMGAYYGGYSLSGDSIGVLKEQFRNKLAASPDLNFLDEFKKGRKSSVQRHFSHFVMCSFLFGEALETSGFEGALSLAFTGRDGVRFFSTLKKVTGIDEDNFHEAMVRLIAD